MLVKYSNPVIKYVLKIKNKKLIGQIEIIILDLKNNIDLSEVKNVKKMKGHPFAYRIKIGNYRLGFYYEDNVIILSRFLKREDIYKVFPN